MSDSSDTNKNSLAAEKTSDKTPTKSLRKSTDSGPEKSSGKFDDGMSEKFSDQLAVAWGTVEKSRHPQRPHTLDYIQRLFLDYEEIRGDRLFGEDPALVAGMGFLKGVDGKSQKEPVFFLGHQKGRTTKQKIERNFGMAKPEGYRKACRVIEMAERFKRPIITFIDTPGAYPGVGAEERGQSEAIATSILKIFKTAVPTVGVVIGEGGSGGALAIGVVDRLMMLENSTYSVISPESCAAILWENAGQAKRAALALKLAAKEVHRLGLCDEVIAEAGSGAHESFEVICETLLKKFHGYLGELNKLSPEKRLELRFQKYRNIDAKHLPKN